MVSFFRTLVIFLAIAASAEVNGGPVVSYLSYRIQVGDTLSEIFDHLGVCPILGAGERVTKTVRINQGRIRKKGDLIVSGQVILLPIKTLRERPGYYELKKNREIIFTGPERVNFCSARDLKVPVLPKKSDEDSSHLPTPPLVTRLTPSETPFDQYSVIEISPKVSFLKLSGNANGETATLLSDMNYGADLAWHQIWSRRFQSFLHLGFKQISIIKSPDRTLSDSSQLYSQLSMGGEYRVSEKFVLGGSLGSEARVFFHATSLTNVNIDKVVVSNAQIWGKWDFYQLGKFATGLSLQAGLLLPTEAGFYRVQAGYSYQTTFYLTQAAGNSKDSVPFLPQGGVFYSQTYQNTSVTSLTSTELGIFFKWGLSWGRSEKEE